MTSAGNLCKACSYLCSTLAQIVAQRQPHNSQTLGMQCTAHCVGGSACENANSTWGQKAKGAAGQKLAVVSINVIPAPYEYLVLASPVLLLSLLGWYTSGIPRSMLHTGEL